MAPRKKPFLIVTGASGGLAQVLCERLHSRFQVIGIDPRPLHPSRRFPGKFFQVPYTHYKLADIFKEYSFEGIVHIGRILWNAKTSLNYRFQQNVLGTQNLLKLAHKHGVKNAIVLSTYHVYGAHQHNHVNITEDEPLRAVQTFPELADAVELDHAATSFLWQFPETRTVVLRPALIIGPHLRNSITTLLQAPFCPTLIGYDPPLQFIHEQDVARAVEIAVQGHARGVYNVAGEGTIPFSRAVRLAGSKPLPLPHPLVKMALGLGADLGMGLPRHLVDYFRFPTIINDARFRKTFGYSPSITTKEALIDIRNSRNLP